MTRAERISAGLKARYAADPEYRAKAGETMRQRWQDPEFRAAQLARLAEAQKDPAIRARISAKRRERKPTGRPLTLAELERSLALNVAAVATLERTRLRLQDSNVKLRQALAEARRDLALARERIARLEAERQEVRNGRAMAAEIGRRLAA